MKSRILQRKSKMGRRMRVGRGSKLGREMRMRAIPFFSGNGIEGGGVKAVPLRKNIFF